MADQRIIAESHALTEEDVRKYEFVKQLVQSQNKVILDFAKLLITIAFSAIGVIFTLKDKWLGPEAASYDETLLTVAVVLFLLTVMVTSLASSAFGHRVSMSDVEDVDIETQRVVKLRYRLTISGYALALTATSLVGVVALRA